MLTVTIIEYFLRPELITLHEADAAYSSNPSRGAQLYMECIQIEVTSNGSVTLPGGTSFPGAYSYGPGIIYNLYGGGGSYAAPGPAPWSGYTLGGGFGGTGTSTLPPGAIPTATGVTPPPSGGSSTAPPPVVVTPTPTPSPPPSTGNCAAKWGQCGGIGYNGPTCCQSGSTCRVSNPYYSQCL